MSKQTQKPKLEVCLDKANELVKQLTDYSQAFQKMKKALHELQADPSSLDKSQFPLLMSIPGTKLTVPVDFEEVDANVYAATVEAVGSTLGAEIISLWTELHSVTGEAAQHCQAAATDAGQRAAGGN